MGNHNSKIAGRFGARAWGLRRGYVEELIIRALRRPVMSRTRNRKSPTFVNASKD
jgi:hypothetical protein